MCNQKLEKKENVEIYEIEGFFFIPYLLAIHFSPLLPNAPFLDFQRNYLFLKDFRDTSQKQRFFLELRFNGSGRREGRFIHRLSVPQNTSLKNLSFLQKTFLSMAAVTLYWGRQIFASAFILWLSSSLYILMTFEPQRELWKPRSQKNY